jgi:2'-5' RNA ligase
VRLFLAVDVDAGAHDALRRVSTAVREVARAGPAPVAVNWVDPSRMHVTLHFLGEVPERDVPTLTGVLAAPLAYAPFEVALGGVGVFPPSGPPRVIWLGCVRGAEGLADLHRLTGERLVALGHTLEPRPFSPHLTMGRVKDRVPHDFRARVTAVEAQGIGPWTVSAVTLYQSRLGPSGADYLVVARTGFAP